MFSAKTLYYAYSLAIKYHNISLSYQQLNVYIYMTQKLYFISYLHSPSNLVQVNVHVMTDRYPQISIQNDELF